MDSPRDSPAPKVPAQPSAWSRLLRARGEWVFVIVTAALTSAGVSVLTTWLAGSRNASTEWVGAVTVSYEPLEPVQASEVEDAAATDDVLTVEPDAAPASEPAEPSSASRDTAAGAVTNVRAPRGDAAVADATTPSRPVRFAVVTVPEGANVTINGVGYGTTPLTIPYLPPGERRIRVTKDGYRTEERTIHGEGGPALRIVLRRSAGASGAQ